VYTHPSIPGTITRTLSVSLPSELVGHVDVLHPTTEFTVPKAHLVPNVSGFDYGHGRGPPASCNSSVTGAVVTPRCLQDLYGIPTTPATEKGNSILVTGYASQWAQSADLIVRRCPFLKCYEDTTDASIVYAKTPETGYTSHYHVQLVNSQQRNEYSGHKQGCCRD
jgi:hypothetical protein